MLLLCCAIGDPNSNASGLTHIPKANAPWIRKEEGALGCMQGHFWCNVGGVCAKSNQVLNCLPFTLHSGLTLCSAWRFLGSTGSNLGLATIWPHVGQDVTYTVSWGAGSVYQIWEGRWGSRVGGSDWEVSLTLLSSWSFPLPRALCWPSPDMKSFLCECCFWLWPSILGLPTCLWRACKWCSSDPLQLLAI